MYYISTSFSYIMVTMFACACFSVSTWFYRLTTCFLTSLISFLVCDSGNSAVRVGPMSVTTGSTSMTYR
jgi:hypothetical protein